MGNGRASRLRKVPCRSLRLRQSLYQRTPIQPSGHLRIARLGQHRWQPGGNLLESPADGVARHHRVQHHLSVLPRRSVVVVGRNLKAVEAQQLRIHAVHLAPHLQRNALVRVLPAPRSGGRPMGHPAIPRVIPNRKADSPSVNSSPFHSHNSASCGFLVSLLARYCIRTTTATVHNNPSRVYPIPLAYSHSTLTAP